MDDNPLNSAIRQFEIVEANLNKLQKIWKKIEGQIPQGICFFGDDIESQARYQNDCRDFEAIWQALPKIDGWKPDVSLMELDQIAQNRLDAQEIDELECAISLEHSIKEPAFLLNEYRYKIRQNRKKLIRKQLAELIDQVDKNLQILAQDLEKNEKIENNKFGELEKCITQIATLLGGNIQRPPRWGDLERHLSFGLVCDLNDIIQHDWPSVKSALNKSLYDENEPIPSEIEDIASLVKNKPKGKPIIELKWKVLSDKDFERLIFTLISSCKSEYENPEWLMSTNAPDKGRDLSVYRIHTDPLADTIRNRVIIQCKNWRSKSVGVPEISTLLAQIKLWEPPRIDVLLIVTSGRFTPDAVSYIEKHNQSDTALRIEMWPESHLERLLTSQPDVIAEFGLR